LLRSPAAAAASQPSPLHPFHRRLWPLVRRSPPPPHHRPAAAFPGPHTASPPGPGNPRARVLITATSLSVPPRSPRTDSFHAPLSPRPRSQISHASRKVRGFLHGPSYAHGVRPSLSMDRWSIDLYFSRLGVLWGVRSALFGERRREISVGMS